MSTVKITVKIKPDAKNPPKTDEAISDLVVALAPHLDGEASLVFEVEEPARDSFVSQLRRILEQRAAGVLATMKISTEESVGRAVHFAPVLPMDQILRTARIPPDMVPFDGDEDTDADDRDRDQPWTSVYG